MAEIGVSRPRRQDQDVVIDRAVGQHNLFTRDVDRRHIGQDHGDVGLMTKDPANGRGDVSRAERGRGDLVEQRLEQVMIGTVDDLDPHGRTPQAVSGGQAAEARTDDHRV